MLLYWEQVAGHREKWGRRRIVMSRRHHCSPSINDAVGAGLINKTAPYIGQDKTHTSPTSAFKRFPPTVGAVVVEGTVPSSHFPIQGRRQKMGDADIWGRHRPVVLGPLTGTNYTQKMLLVVENVFFYKSSVFN